MMTLNQALAIVHVFGPLNCTAAQRRVVQQARGIISFDAGAAMEAARERNRLADLGGKPLRPDAPSASAAAPTAPADDGSRPYTTRMTPREIETAFGREPKHANTPFRD